MGDLGPFSSDGPAPTSCSHTVAVSSFISFFSGLAPCEDQVTLFL